MKFLEHKTEISLFGSSKDFSNQRVKFLEYKSLHLSLKLDSLLSFWGRCLLFAENDESEVGVNVSVNYVSAYPLKLVGSDVGCGFGSPNGLGFAQAHDLMLPKFLVATPFISTPHNSFFWKTSHIKHIVDN